MKCVINRGAVLLAATAIVVSGVRAGIVGGFATEWTQLANNLQLVNSYIRQGEQLRQEILMVLDMAKNSTTLPSQVFGPIANDISQLAGIVQGGRALAYSMANLDAEFRSRFRGWGYNSRTWFLDYRDWSQTSLDTIQGTLRAAGFASPATTERTGGPEPTPIDGRIVRWPVEGAPGGESDRRAASAAGDEATPVDAG